MARFRRAPNCSWSRGHREWQAVIRRPRARPSYDELIDRHNSGFGWRKGCPPVLISPTRRSRSLPVLASQELLTLMPTARSRLERLIVSSRAALGWRSFLAGRVQRGRCRSPFLATTWFDVGASCPVTHAWGLAALPAQLCGAAWRPCARLRWDVTRQSGAWIKGSDPGLRWR